MRAASSYRGAKRRAAREAKARPAVSEGEIAEKIKIEDIDKALENTLTKWQADGHTEPLPLSRLFAARARQLGWIEGVEFAEDKICA